MITVATFDNLIYAEMFKAKLESEGVRCCIADGNMVALDWRLSNALGGIKVQILDEDVERVRPILEKMDEIPGQFIFLPPKKACPACGSMNVSRRPWPLMLSILTLGFPLLFCRRGFTCNECGHQFEYFATEQENENETTTDPAGA